MIIVTEWFDDPDKKNYPKFGYKAYFKDHPNIEAIAGSRLDAIHSLISAAYRFQNIQDKVGISFEDKE